MRRISGRSTCGARYLSRDNSKFDKATAYDVSEFVIYSGLLPTDFNNAVGTLSFTSSKTPSHNSPPGTFSTLEGMPYGNMTSFRSPVDPIFFLHHANMDRLWDVWTRKQKALNLPYLPPQPDRKTLSDAAKTPAASRSRFQPMRSATDASRSA